MMLNTWSGTWHQVCKTKQEFTSCDAFAVTSESPCRTSLASHPLIHYTGAPFVTQQWTTLTRTQKIKRKCEEVREDNDRKLDLPTAADTHVHHGANPPHFPSFIIPFPQRSVLFPSPWWMLTHKRFHHVQHTPTHPHAHTHKLNILINDEK